MTDEIVGSHFKSQRERGQNQDQTGSSTHEKTLPIIPNVAPPNASADAGDWQTRQLKGGNQTPDNVPIHNGMKNRSTTVETVPAATMRRDSGKKLLR